MSRNSGFGNIHIIVVITIIIVSVVIFTIILMIPIIIKIILLAMIVSRSGGHLFEGPLASPMSTWATGVGLGLAWKTPTFATVCTGYLEQATVAKGSQQ